MALFLLVLHHNFLGLSSLLRNEVSGMGTLIDILASIEDLEFPVSHILSYITRLKEKKASFLPYKSYERFLDKAWWYFLCSLVLHLHLFSLLCSCLLRVWSDQRSHYSKLEESLWDAAICLHFSRAGLQKVGTVECHWCLMSAVFTRGSVWLLSFTLYFPVTCGTVISRSLVVKQNHKALSTKFF